MRGPNGGAGEEEGRDLVPGSGCQEFKRPTLSTRAFQSLYHNRQEFNYLWHSRDQSLPGFVTKR